MSLDQLGDVRTSVVIVAEGNAVHQEMHNPDKQTIFAAMMAEDVCREHNIEPQCLLAELIDRRVGQQVR